MDTQTSETLAQMESHLKKVTGLLGTLTGSTSSQVRSECDGGNLLEQYKASEKRANEAEVRLAKLHREIDLIKSKASASVRDIQQLAFQDELTGLANRHLICRHLDSLAKTASLDHQSLVLLVDIDHFQTVNGVFGHDRGDEILTRVGERLSQLAGEEAAVGRLGEDEFIIVVSGIPLKQAESRARRLAESIRQMLETPFQVQGQKLELTVSQGASLMPESASGSREVIQQARTALSNAKRQGRNLFRLYNADLHRQIQRDATLELQLRYALEADELYLEYLPFVHLERDAGNNFKGHVVGVEALLRWRHRVEGILEPEQFLPIAERTGHIVPIGEHMIRQVFQQCRLWRESGADLSVAVNLAGRQLLDSELADKVRREAKAAEVSPERITLEFQEEFELLNEELIDRTLLELRQCGFGLALDRFGEGGYTLQRLCRSQYLKLSPQLVQGDRELCRRAIEMAGSLGLLCIGVGVEDAATAKFLVANGCQTMQGFYFSKPLEARAVTELFGSQRMWTL